DRPIYRSARQLLSYELARLLPQQLGLPPHAAPFLDDETGWYWFHWLGELYGQAALDLIRYRASVGESQQPGLCLRLQDAPHFPPPWGASQVKQYLEDNYRRYESV